MPSKEASEIVSGESRLATESARRILVACGWMLVLAGFVHVPIWLASGQPWEGTVSWRKPILFGISGGLTLVSFGFLFNLLAPKRWNLWLAGTLSGAMFLEVGLISVQQWRGVASHFNRSTTFDRVIDTAVTGLISLVSLCIVVLCVRAFRYLNASLDQRIAWRSGLVFLLLSCALGFAVLAYGVVQTARGADPTVFGDAGVVKFPHGMTIHAIQLLPCLCWLMTRLKIPLATRTAALHAANRSLACLLCYSVVQTLSGQARSDLTVFSGCILLASAAFAAPLILVIARALTSRYTSDRLAASR